MFLPQTRNIIFFCLGRNFDRPSEPTASYKHFIGRNAVPLKMTKFNLFVFSFPGLSRFNGLDRLIRPKFKSNVLLRFFFHLQEMHFFLFGRNFDRPTEPTAGYKHFICRNTVPLKMTKFLLFFFSFPGLSRFNGLG